MASPAGAMTSAALLPWNTTSRQVDIVLEDKGSRFYWCVCLEPSALCVIVCKALSYKPVSGTFSGLQLDASGL